jgi:hypothetical protein
MSNRGPRNLQLLSQIGEKNRFKMLAPTLLDISSDFEQDMQAVRANRKLSAEGKRNEARDLARKALRARDDRKKPIAEFHAQTERMKAKVKLPDLDRTDEYAVRLHFRMLDLSYDMTPLERMGLMTGPGRDPDFIDSVSREKPWHSGFREKGELDVLAAAKTERLAELFGPLQATIAERESEESEIRMLDNMVRGDLLIDSVDSGLSRAEFEAEAKAIESKPAAEAPKAPPDRTRSAAPEIEARYLAEMQEIDARFNRRVDEILSGSAA